MKTILTTCIAASMMMVSCGGGDSLNDLETYAEEEVSLDGHSGLHFKGVAESLHIEYQMYLVENRLYQIGIVRDGSYATQDRVDTFLGTFELTD